MHRQIHRPPGYHHPHRLLVFCFFTKVVHVVGEPVDFLDTQKKVDKLTRLQKDVDQRFGDMRMFIGNGIGISRIPLRMGAQPQIYLLNFGREDLL